MCERASLCFRRNMMLKRADRQKRSLSGVAMVTVPSVSKIFSILDGGKFCSKKKIKQGKWIE